MLLAEVGTGAWAALSGVLTLIGGGIAAWVTLRGNARSTTVQVDMIRAEANDETIRNLLSDNQRLIARAERAETAETRWRSLFEDCRDQLEHTRRELYGDHPDRWRYRPPDPTP